MARLWGGVRSWSFEEVGDQVNAVCSSSQLKNLFTESSRFYSSLSLLLHTYCTMITCIQTVHSTLFFPRLLSNILASVPFTRFFLFSLSLWGQCFQSHQTIGPDPIRFDYMG